MSSSLQEGGYCNTLLHIQLADVCLDRYSQYGQFEGNLRLCRKQYAKTALWHVCFVDFVSVSLELLQCNLELKNSLKTLSYHFDFYVGTQNTWNAYW